VVVHWVCPLSATDINYCRLCVHPWIILHILHLVSSHHLGFFLGFIDHLRHELFWSGPWVWELLNLLIHHDHVALLHLLQAFRLLFGSDIARMGS